MKNKKLKICMIIPFELADDRGDKMRESRIAKMLNYQGVDLHIIALNSSLDVGKLHKIPHFSKNIWIHQLCMLFFGFPQALYIKFRYKPNVFFVRGEIPSLIAWFIKKIWKSSFCIDQCDIASYLFNMKERQKYVAFTLKSRENKFKKKVANFVNKRIASNCNLFTVEKEYQKKAIHAHGVELKKILKVSPGLDLNKYSNTKREKKIYTLIFVGNLDESHFQMIYPIINKLDKITKKPNFKMIIVGGGPYKEKLEKICEKKDIVNKVIFTGYQPHDKVIKYLKKSEIALSYTAGQNVYEYCALSMPIIVFDGKDTREVLKDACLYAKNWNDYIEKIIKLISDKKLQQELSKKARKLAESRSVEKISKKLVDKMREIAN